jgi:hypothetical protein
VVSLFFLLLLLRQVRRRGALIDPFHTGTLFLFCFCFSLPIILLDDDVFKVNLFFILFVEGHVEMKRRQTITAAVAVPLQREGISDDAEDNMRMNKSMQRLHDVSTAAATYPQINITVESSETTSSWGSIRSAVRSYYPPLTDLERTEYYSNYDPMTGIKIASTLSAFFTMAVLYVVYKVHTL